MQALRLWLATAFWKLLGNIMVSYIMYVVYVCRGILSVHTMILIQALVIHTSTAWHVQSVADDAHVAS